MIRMPFGSVPSQNGDAAAALAGRANAVMRKNRKHVARRGDVIRAFMGEPGVGVELYPIQRVRPAWHQDVYASAIPSAPQTASIMFGFFKRKPRPGIETPAEVPPAPQAPEAPAPIAEPAAAAAVPAEAGWFSRL